MEVKKKYQPKHCETFSEYRKIEKASLKEILDKLKVDELPKRTNRRSYDLRNYKSRIKLKRDMES